VKVSPTTNNNPSIDPLKPSGSDGDEPGKSSHIDDKHEITIVYIYDE